VEEEEETSCTGKKETCARSRGGGEREAVWGRGGADGWAPLGVAAAVSTDRALRGVGETRRGAGLRLGRARQLGRQAGPKAGRGGAGAPAGPRLEAGPKGGRGREFPFLFFS
jgi:hypothetical protein